MNIRTERPDDYEAVYSLVEQAFASAEHSDGTEQDLVAALRKGEAFVPELSLVAEIDGKIVGHILFTEAKVGGDTVLVLAPLSVLPAYQRRGVGTDSGRPPDCQKTGICLLIGLGERNLLSALWVSACGIVRHRDPGRDATRKLFGDPPAGGCKASPWSGDLCKGIWHLRNVPKAGTFFRRT